MLFSSLRLCRFIDFWSKSFSKVASIGHRSERARWCVCFQDYTYFTWYVVSQSQFFFQVAIFFTTSLLHHCRPPPATPRCVEAAVVDTTGARITCTEAKPFANQYNEANKVAT